LAGLSVLVVADAVLGWGYRTDRHAHVDVIGPRSGVVRRAIVVLPGYAVSGRLVGEGVRPYVRSDDALVVVDYAQRGVDAGEIYDAVMAELHVLDPAELRIYGASMGGMLGKLFAERYHQDGEPFGGLVLILDSAPAERGDVKRPGWLFGVSCRYHGGPVSSALWAGASTFGSHPEVAPGADQALIGAAHHAGDRVGLPAATTQACLMDHFTPLVCGELRGVVRQVVYLQSSAPDDDPWCGSPGRDSTGATLSRT
jgi:hypothetical protein